MIQNTLRFLILFVLLSTSGQASLNIPSLHGLGDDETVQRAVHIIPAYTQKISEDKWGELGEHFGANLDIIGSIMERYEKSKGAKTYGQSYKDLEQQLIVFSGVMQRKSLDLLSNPDFLHKLESVLQSENNLPNYVKTLPTSLLFLLLLPKK